MASKKITIRLARPIEDGQRIIEAVAIEGETGPSQFPLNRDRDGAEIDMLVVQRVVALRTGLSEVAISKMSGLDFFGLFFALFVMRTEPEASRSKGKSK